MHPLRTTLLTALAARPCAAAARQFICQKRCSDPDCQHGGTMRLTSVHAAMVCAAALALYLPAQAQEVPRSFAASPDVYKVIGENDQYRVIAATWAPGQRDNWHSHGAVVAVYALTDCNVRLHTPDGQYRDGKLKAGDSRVGPQAPKHVFENAGSSECRLILFEPK